MLGIPQESGKSGPIKAQYIIRVLWSAEGRIIDALDSDYGRDWNIGLYDIVSAASTKKVEKHGQMLWKGRSVSGKVSYGYCPFCLKCCFVRKCTEGSQCSRKALCVCVCVGKCTCFW